MPLRRDIDPGVSIGYLNFLYDIVGGKNGPCRNYYYLMGTLLDIDFYWTISNDDNRCEDGLDLRREYAYKEGIVDEIFNYDCCTVLEMLVGLSRRIERDITYSDSNPDLTGVWFCQLIANLGLLDCTNDLYSDKKQEKVIRNVYTFMDRTYDFDGKGGLFPLKDPHEDQRNVEIWKQMASYFTEKGY